MNFWSKFFKNWRIQNHFYYPARNYQARWHMVGQSFVSMRVGRYPRFQRSNQDTELLQSKTSTFLFWSAWTLKILIVLIMRKDPNCSVLISRTHCLVLLLICGLLYYDGVWAFLSFALLGEVGISLMKYNDALQWNHQVNSPPITINVFLFFTR